MRWRPCGELATDIGQQPEFALPARVEWRFMGEPQEPC